MPWYGPKKTKKKGGRRRRRKENRQKSKEDFRGGGKLRRKGQERTEKRATHSIEKGWDWSVHTEVYGMTD